MILKLVKGVWFLSLMVWLVVFLYVYASLPENVIIRESSEIILLSRNALFYSFLVSVAVVNIPVFAVSRLHAGKDVFLTWFYGLIICLNFFFTIVVNFLNLVNSGEKFDYTRLGVIIYGSLALFIAWSIAWPVCLIFRKFFSKPAV